MSILAVVYVLLGRAVTEYRWGGSRNILFKRHKLLVLTVKKNLQPVYTYGSYRKIKTGVPFFWTIRYRGEHRIIITPWTDCRQNTQAGAISRWPQQDHLRSTKTDKYLQSTETMPTYTSETTWLYQTNVTLQGLNLIAAFGRFGRSQTRLSRVLRPN